MSANHRAGYKDWARRAVTRCRRAACPRQGAALTAIAGGDDEAMTLTPRMRTGRPRQPRLTNAQMADRPVLPVRTVESRLTTPCEARNRQDLDSMLVLRERPRRPAASFSAIMVGIATDSVISGSSPSPPRSSHSSRALGSRMAMEDLNRAAAPAWGCRSRSHEREAAADLAPADGRAP